MRSLVAACKLLVVACMWDLVPRPGIKPGPLHWECRVLTTAPPGKSRRCPFNETCHSPLRTGYLCPHRYWHRSLNPRKLIEVKFSHLSRNMTMQRTMKLYRLPEASGASGPWAGAGGRPRRASPSAGKERGLVGGGGSLTRKATQLVVSRFLAFPSCCSVACSKVFILVGLSLFS